MTNHRKISLTAGILYLLTFVSVPTLALYSQVKDANYVLGTGTDTATIIAGLLEITVALSAIATAVVLFPILKKIHESAALGLVAIRILEATAIFVGVASILTIVTLRENGAGADALAVSNALASFHDRMFLISQSFIPAVCDLLLGILFYKSRLIPRSISIIGIIGAPLLLAGYFAVMFGLLEQRAPLAGASAIGVALFEILLGVWLVVKGLNPKAVAALESKK